LKPICTDKFLEAYEVIQEYIWPRRTSAHFTFNRHQGSGPRNFLDNGQCDICGQRGERVLIDPPIPKTCYRCYQLVRAYRRLPIDPLRLHRRRSLSTQEARRIRDFMRDYSQKIRIAIPLIAAFIFTQYGEGD
jgi:hypothetical protein